MFANARTARDQGGASRSRGFMDAPEPRGITRSLKGERHHEWYSTTREARTKVRASEAGAGFEPAISGTPGAVPGSATPHA